MATKTSDTEMSFHVRLAIARYAPRWQAAITEAVAKRMQIAESESRKLTAEEIGECASAVIMGRRNKRIEELCREELRNGQSKSFREIIDELRASIAEPTQG